MCSFSRSCRQSSMATLGLGLHSWCNCSSHWPVRVAPQPHRATVAQRPHRAACGCQSTAQSSSGLQDVSAVTAASSSLYGVSFSTAAGEVPQSPARLVQARIVVITAQRVLLSILGSTFGKCDAQVMLDCEARLAVACATSEHIRSQCPY